MARPARSELDEETFPVPGSVRFPVELTPPDGFDRARLETWPRVAGRLEWVAGRLLYMPPCEERQSWTVADLVFTLGHWVRSHPGFVFGTNEPGILLRDDVRAADAAIWRRAEARPASPGVSRRSWQPRSAAATRARGSSAKRPAGTSTSEWAWCGYSSRRSARSSWSHQRARAATRWASACRPIRASPAWRRRSTSSSRRSPRADPYAGGGGASPPERASRNVRAVS